MEPASTPRPSYPQDNPETRFGAVSSMALGLQVDTTRKIQNLFLLCLRDQLNMGLKTNNNIFNETQSAPCGTLAVT